MEGSWKEYTYRVTEKATPRFHPAMALSCGPSFRLRVLGQVRADATVPQHAGLPEGSQKEISARQGAILGGAVRCPDPLHPEAQSDWAWQMTA